jgi:hypothetical protein
MIIILLKNLVCFDSYNDDYEFIVESSNVRSDIMMFNCMIRRMEADGTIVANVIIVQRIVAVI